SSDLMPLAASICSFPSTWAGFEIDLIFISIFIGNHRMNLKFNQSETLIISQSEKTTSFPLKTRDFYCPRFKVGRMGLVCCTYPTSLKAICGFWLACERTDVVAFKRMLFFVNSAV